MNRFKIKNFEDFYSLSNLVVSHVIERFAVNNLVLNLDKMNIMKLITNNSLHSSLDIGYKEKYIEQRVNTKFTGLQTNNHINWKNHIQQMIPKCSM